MQIENIEICTSPVNYRIIEFTDSFRRRRSKSHNVLTEIVNRLDKNIFTQFFNPLLHCLHIENLIECREHLWLHLDALLSEELIGHKEPLDKNNIDTMP